MANKHTTLTGLFTAIANAIRRKTGGTNTIVADNFPDAITNMPAHGILKGNNETILSIKHGLNRIPTLALISTPTFDYSGFNNPPFLLFEGTFALAANDNSERGGFETEYFGNTMTAATTESKVQFVFCLNNYGFITYQNVNGNTVILGGPSKKMSATITTVTFSPGFKFPSTETYQYLIF